MGVFGVKALLTDFSVRTQNKEQLCFRGSFFDVAAGKTDYQLVAMASAAMVAGLFGVMSN